MASALARARLIEERKNWRKDKPFGFIAGPDKKPDGETDLTRWTCWIPGKEGTPWEGVNYKLQLRFNDEYPVQPPIAYFVPPIFHINVFENGQVCMSLLYEDKDWRPNISVKQLLLGIQELLDHPNPGSVARPEAYELHRTNRAAYTERIRREAQEYKRKYNKEEDAEEK